MSDNNVCPICEGYDTTAGIVHAPGCPNNKPVTWIFPDSANPQAEIARLKDALEKAERERRMAVDMRDTAWICYRNAQKERDEAREKLNNEHREWYNALHLMTYYHNASEKFKAERDEARKWAKYWYRAYNEDV